MNQSSFVSKLSSLLLCLLFFLGSSLYAQNDAAAPAPTAKKGADVTITFNNIPDTDKSTINTAYTVDSKDGTIKMPYLKSRVFVAGKTAREITAILERLYVEQGIYSQPIVTVNVGANVSGEITQRTVQVTGYVGSKQNLPYRQGMTLIEALLACGDITDYGSRRIQITRNGQTRIYDYFSARDRAIVLHENDVIYVMKRGMFEGRLDALIP